jgi:hypothetical protein
MRTSFEPQVVKKSDWKANLGITIVITFITTVLPVALAPLLHRMGWCPICQLW